MSNVLQFIRERAAETNTTVEKYVEIVTDYETHTATERSDPDARKAAKSAIFEMYHADPDAELDPGKVAVRAGLKDCQADRSFVRHQLKQARLTHQMAAE